MAKDETKHEFELYPFDLVVKKGFIVQELESRRQAVVQCESKDSLPFAEISAYNEWLTAVEKDLTKARTRIEREFKLTSALMQKVHEPRRRAQLQGRLSQLRAQCVVLNEAINAYSQRIQGFRGDARAASEGAGGWARPSEKSVLSSCRVADLSEDLDVAAEDREEADEQEEVAHKKKRRRKKKKAAEVTGVVEMKKEDSTSEDDARVAAQAQRILWHPLPDWSIAELQAPAVAGAGVDVWAYD